MNKFILDISALQKNIGFVKSKLKKSTLFCAMVKANAYGHNIKHISKNIQHLVDFFGVACVSEALILRKLNIVNPILVVGSFDKKTAKQAVINYVTITVCSLEQLDYLYTICAKLHICANVHIKVNTGMNRLGVTDKNIFLKMLNFIKGQTFIKLQGVFSHLSCSENKAFTNMQNRRFKYYVKLTKMLFKPTLHNIIFHLSSSFGAINYKKLQYDMVRVGLAMYGYGNKNLQPVLNIVSEIRSINCVKKGEYIGYNATFKCNYNTLTAVVPIGYGDGLNFKLSNNASVIILNTTCKILGRICMDMFICDITHLKHKLAKPCHNYRQSKNEYLQTGTPVIILNSQNNASVFADICGTHEYEILTSFKQNRMKLITDNQVR